MASLFQNDKILAADIPNSTCKTSEMKPPASNMPVQSFVDKRYNNITKSPNDKRLYRGLVLTNKMKVVLVSDPTTDKSAAAMNVNIGYLNDPEDLPGLAHFCEHMLFLGTHKYPETNEYNKFLSQNGGSSNASTHMDYTNYYFDVNSEKLEGALDRFAQFFLKPLFTETSTELELNAIHLEHQNNLASDTWRCDQLDKSSADPKHAYSKFGTGNKETLESIPKQKNINVREKLLEFHEKYYSSNIMSLCVLGKENLDELENMVIELFSEIKNKEVEVPVWSEHPFSEEHFQTKWYIVPIKDLRSLHIIFALPDLQEYYQSGLTHYVAHLLGHEGKGSLLSALKAKEWSNSLVSGRRAGARGFNFFDVIVDLTEEGIQHVDDITLMTFQYINMLKKNGPLEWIFNECRLLSDMHFRFKEKCSPFRYVCFIARAMQIYPMEEVITAEYFFPSWRPDLINWVIDYLKPENVRVHVIGKCYESIANESEEWYGTKYKKEKIPKDTIDKWTNAGYNSDLKLPLKNEFIPEKFDLKPSEGTVTKFPVIVEDTPLIRLWFKQDDEFLVPKVMLTMDFVSPLAYMDPISFNLSYMFVQLFHDVLNEYAYAADLAGLKWDIKSTRSGITLDIGGFDDKLRVLLEKILDKMVSFKVDPKRFEILKENYIRSLKNFEAEQPYHHAVYYLSVLLWEKVWMKDELLKATSHLTAERVQQFIPQFLSKVHIECLMHGNVTKSEAIETARLVESKLTSSIPNIIPLLPKQLLLQRQIKLEDDSNFIFEVENKLHKSSCTEVYYETGLQSTESNMLLELLVQIISEPCFTTLRTKEQLGYIVFSGVRRSNGPQGFRIIVQSDRHPQYVEQRINVFLESMLDHITTMSDEEFNKYKESLAVHRLEKPKTLVFLFAVFWNEILVQQYNFDRANIEVAHLKTISREELLRFYKDAIHSDKQRKLSVHVISTIGEFESIEENPVKDDEKSSNNTIKSRKKIDDIMAFKNSQSLHPLLKPFNDVPRKGAHASKL